MSDILVIGNIGIDEIWRLDRPLRPGRRLRCLERIRRVGGGAANTAAALLTTGHTPRIAATLRTDTLGDTLLAHLTTAGFATDGIERIPGPTTPGVILLDPDGERTLIGGASRSYTLPRTTPASADITYLNFASLADPSTLARLTPRLLVAQLPLNPTEPRPANILIASRSDMDHMTLPELWALRRTLDGPTLHAIILTRGPEGAGFITESEEGFVPSPAILQADSIGAGDFFAAGLLSGLADTMALPQAIERGHSTAHHCLQTRPTLLRVLPDTPPATAQTSCATASIG